MSKLEDQLRKSREEERPDFQPPAGGWEAIQASLAGTAAGVGSAAVAAEAAANTGAMGAAGAASTAAGTSAVVGAEASLLVISLKALLGLCVVGGLAAGAWVTLGSDDQQETEVATTTVVETRLNEDMPQVISAPINRVDPSNETAAGETPGTTRATTGNKVSEGEQIAGAKLPTPSEKDQASPTTQEEGLAMPNASGVNIGPSTVPAAGDEAKTGSEHLAGIPEEGRATVPNAVAEPPTDGPECSNVAPPLGEEEPNQAAEAGLRDSADTPLTGEGVAAPTTGFNQVATPQPSQVNLVVQPLARTPAKFVPNLSKTLFTGFESLNFFDEENEDGNFRKFMRPVRPSWQVHGGAQVMINNRFSFRGGNNFLLQRTSNGLGGFQVTLPDGEVVNANFTGTFTGSNTRTDNFLFRIGATRQTAWGGAFRATLGYFNGSEQQVQDFSQLGPDELAFDIMANSSAATLELGFQYTFLRRHKFRPYLGVNSMFYFGSSLVEEQSVFDNQTGQRAFISSIENYAGSSFWQGISISAGFQYQLFPRVSAGGYLWAHGSKDLWIEAPVGIEVRYLLK